MAPAAATAAAAPAAAAAAPSAGDHESTPMEVTHDQRLAQ